MARSMAILLCVVLYTLFTVNPVVDGKHFKSALVKMHPDSMNEVAPQSKADSKGPTLFDMLMSALSDTEQMEEESRRKELQAQSQSGTKPCYWSLVSCYRKKK